MDDKIINAYVNIKGLAQLVCPHCFKSNSANVEKYLGRSEPLRVKCKCKNTYKVNLEFRKCHRKAVLLEGTYFIGKVEKIGGPVLVNDLSETGVRFQVQGMHSIKIGDKGTISITLDDKKRTKLEKEIEVRSIHGDQIGCEFGKVSAFERDLGFYMRM